MKLDWERIFLNGLQLPYVAEILIRTSFMFFLVLILLRLSGKRGVRQLSFFEVAIIISFGSAAADPMFNKDLAIVPCIIVLAAIVTVYRSITWLTMKSEHIESVFEGDPEYVIEDGMFVLIGKNGKTFAKDEFLCELRQQSVEHLGQVRVAILETNGEISFIFYADSEVKYGMPVLPKAYSQMSEHIAAPGIYACTACGHTAQLAQAEPCSRCRRNIWVKAINTKRTT